MDKFTSKHLMYLILGTAVISMKTYPTIYILYGGRDSWISVIISSILIILFFLYLIKIFETSNSFNLYKVYCSSLGARIGTILIYLFIFMLFLTLIECSSVEASSMHTNMLLETPAWYISIFFIFPGAYAVRKGKVAVMLITIIGITLIMLAGINLFILTMKYKKFKCLFPMLQYGIDLNFLKSIISSLGMYGGISIVLPYFTEIKLDGKFKKNVLIGLVILVQMEIVSTIGIITTFDVNRTMIMSYPKLLQTQLVSYFGFLESGELFVMLQIVGGWFIKYILTLLSMNLLLNAMNIKTKYFFYIISMLAYIFSYYASKNLLTLFTLLSIYNYLSFFNYIIIPFIVFTIFYIKLKYKNKSLL